MPTMDVFNANAFNLISLTDRVNKMPFVPGKAGRLGIFGEKGTRTTTVAIEEYAGTLALVPTSPRGGPENQNVHQKRKLRNLNVPHLPINDAVYPDEIQNVRAFGQESELMGVQQVVDQRMQEMNYKLDATVEYQRIGALKGLLLDSDGSTVIYNLFTEFGVSQDTVDFVLGTAGTDVIGKWVTVKGLIEDELGMDSYDHIHVFAGKTWWAEYISHPKIATAYQYFEAGGQRVNPLREDLRYQGFTFADVTVEQYRGKVSNVSFIADAEAYAFPVGPDIYRTYYAPADFMETVNTMGLPRYAKQVPDPSGLNRYRQVHVQTNPLSLCTRPKTLIKLTTSN